MTLLEAGAWAFDQITHHRVNPHFERIFPHKVYNTYSVGSNPMKNMDLSPEDAARVLNQLLGKKRPRHEISPQVVCTFAIYLI